MLNRDNPGLVGGVQGTSAGGVIASAVRAGEAGFEELLSGLRFWRVWHLLGIRELRHRYARSKLGQFWLMLSSGIMIGVLGGTWSLLWHQPLRELLPFLGTGLIVWTYLSQVLIDCTAVFVTHGNLYRNQKMNFAVSIYSVLYRNTLVLAHSLVIVVILIVLFGVPVNWYQLQIIPAFALTCITMLWTGYLVAMICVRYRDIVQVITTWLTVLFFVMPIMWKPEFLPEQYRFIINLNPLAQILEMLRNPLLGEPVGAYTWLSTATVAFGGGLFALAVIGRYHRRIVFWM
jgi:ABC-type polysaccharide/polyol phosphate export permease